MGVDYYHCEVCDESHYEEYVGSCTECSSRLCTKCLVNDDVKSRYASHYGVRFDFSNLELMQSFIDEEYIYKDEDGVYCYKYNSGNVEEGDLVDDSAIAPKYCPFCQGTQINSDEVLTYLLNKYQLKIDEVWSEMKNK